jgi:hypothetical protein
MEREENGELRSPKAEVPKQARAVDFERTRGK